MLKDHFSGTTPPDIRLTTARIDRKSTRLNSSHGYISYAVFCLKKKRNPQKLGRWAVLPLAARTRPVNSASGPVSGTSEAHVPGGKSPHMPPHRERTRTDGNEAEMTQGSIAC